MKPILNSEYNELEMVLVHTPGEEHNQLIPWDGDHALMGSYPRVYEELQNDHSQLKALLQKYVGKKNVLEFSTLLEEVFENEDYRYRFNILKDTLYGNAETYIDHLQARGIKLETYSPKELVRDLIEGYPRILNLNNHRLPQIIIPPKRELMWMRDSAAVTPVGMVICNMSNPRRKLETSLVRAAFKYHPMFDEDSIFLDMVEVTRKIKEDPAWSGLTDHLLLEGGNIMVLNEECIAIGVGRYENLYANRTTRAAFNLLVEKLFEADKSGKLKRIYMVHVPDLNGFIHLDMVFNMIGPKSAIVMPYIFGHPDPIVEISPKAVLQNFVHWLRRNMGENRTDMSKIPNKVMFEHAGKVEVYDRDYIKQKGSIVRLPHPSRYFLNQLFEDKILDPDSISWIGGPLKNYITPYEHLKVALFEQNNMAGNVMTVAPHKVISYQRSKITSDALLKDLKRRDEHAEVHLMSSNEIRTDNGGPHCLAMPLKRATPKVDQAEK
ncbi:MAG: arginine deiminase family protein [Bacteroidia bacterium]|nr:arginine deiminase family protein [Bacteroidia bacterium]